MARVGAVPAVVVAVILVDPDPSIHRTAAQSHPGPIDAPLAAVSGDGAFVAFESLAQLVPADTNPGQQHLRAARQIRQHRAGLRRSRRQGGKRERSRS